MEVWILKKNVFLVANFHRYISPYHCIGCLLILVCLSAVASSSSLDKLVIWNFSWQSNIYSTGKEWFPSMGMFVSCANEIDLYKYFQNVDSFSHRQNLTRKSFLLFRLTSFFGIFILWWVDGAILEWGQSADICQAKQLAGVVGRTTCLIYIALYSCSMTCGVAEFPCNLDYNCRMWLFRNL